jgi:hypothetical protein
MSSVDLLDSTSLSKEQKSLVDLTRVCARTLLDTINGIHIGKRKEEERKEEERKKREEIRREARRRREEEDQRTKKGNDKNTRYIRFHQNRDWKVRTGQNGN